MGDERRRHCEACARVVVYLSALTRGEVAALVATPCAEQRCVRYVCDAGGVIEFADTKRPPVQPERPRPMMGRIAPPRPEPKPPAPEKPPAKR